MHQCMLIAMTEPRSQYLEKACSYMNSKLLSYLRFATNLWPFKAHQGIYYSNRLAAIAAILYRLFFSMQCMVVNTTYSYPGASTP